MFPRKTVDVSVGGRDELGETQQIPQGEGGEQGDPLMPMLFSLGQHPALEAVQSRLRDKMFFAYLDDVVFVCKPDRVAKVEASSEKSHQGKTEQGRALRSSPG